MGELLTANPTVRAYLFQLPLYVVWLVGIILSMTRWQWHPKASSAALAAFCLFFLESLVGTLLSYNLPRFLAQGRHLDGEHVALVLHMVWLGRTIVHAVLWGWYWWQYSAGARGVGVLMWKMALERGACE